MRGYVEQRTTFGSRLNAKTIMVRYMIVNSPSSYNVIIGRHSLNALGGGLYAAFNNEVPHE